jgi:predicted Zn-dependent protease/predicted negative regulator of RcsB-dependent stress response
MTLRRSIGAVIVAGSLVASPACNAVTAFQEAIERRTIGEIERLYDAEQYEAVIQRSREFVAQRPQTLESASVLMFKAESEHELGRFDTAINDYQSALVIIEKTVNNVNQRRYASAYFRLGAMLQERQRIDAAIATVEAGLRLTPQYVAGQIQLGDMLATRGDRDRALHLYRSILASPLPVSEERVVLNIKIDRLTPGEPGASIRPADMSGASFYPNLSIGLIQLNGVRKEVHLVDVCMILEVSWRIRCEVLEPFTIAESKIFVAGRGQYDADRILDELRRRWPESSSRQHAYLVAVTDRDIFGPNTSFVFSWQGAGDRGGTGVLSTSRFVAEIPPYYEPEIIATRRVAVQALSTTGRMMRFTRPTDPECPLAYPESFREFQQKRLQLCDSDVLQRDQLLARLGGAPVPLGHERSDAYMRLRRQYFIE